MNFKAFPHAVRKALLRRTPAGRVALVGFIAVVLAAVAVSSVVRARVSPQRDVATNKAATGKAEFVPGEILVRFRASDAPEADSVTASMPLEDGRTVAVEFERFGGSELVEGLRLARVPADATLDAVAALSARADVLYAAPNYIRRKTATTPNDPSFGNMYALRNTGQNGGTADADIDADEAWDTTRGSSSVVVGIIDEGVDVNHPDLTENIWRNTGETPANGIDDDGNGFVDDLHGWDFVHDDGSVFDSADGEDHGTHVAGTVGARGNNSVGIVGVNWEVSLMSLKVLGPSGGNDRDIIDAYRYAKLMRQRGVNLRVLNNSYGGTGYQPAAADAIRELGEVGILFVAAAGNSSRDNFQIPHYPSDYELPNVISVAATTRFDNLASFSNFGPRKVTMGAPGSSILSTTPNNTYSSFGGTSMASPHVAGVAALYKQANPSASSTTIRNAIVNNATTGVVSNPGSGSPNRLLYSRFF
jgi:subtilisin family serine protease